MLLDIRSHSCEHSTSNFQHKQVLSLHKHTPMAEVPLSLACGRIGKEKKREDICL